VAGSAAAARGLLHFKLNPPLADASDGDWIDFLIASQKGRRIG
jgi:hypothetical protein